MNKIISEVINISWAVLLVKAKRMRWWCLLNKQNQLHVIQLLPFSNLPAKSFCICIVLIDMLTQWNHIFSPIPCFLFIYVFWQFEPAPRRGEPDVTRRTPDYFLWGRSWNCCIRNGEFLFPVAEVLLAEWYVIADILFWTYNLLTQVG